ncbi:MAG: ABC transporter ATP-binding protein, partial [Clostridia bacterium]|nr:ABC transporter ATP-binding protein [Clostridia bacterium]
MAMIKIRNLNKRYGEKVVYENFNLDIEKDKVLVILGKSGCGKTTLLNVLAKLTEYDGQIEGVDDSVSMVFQKDYLVPNLTVEQNLKLVNKNADVLSALEMVEMTECAKLYPKSLSGGMARRVAIIRAIIFKSTLLVMDEPTNSLDVGLKNKIYSTLKQLKKEYKKTVVIVT